MSKPRYITTPIYYVNDRPHIGHCYTTGMADCLARFERLARGAPAGDALSGRGVFLLTGTDEHADKVVTSAAAHNMTPLQWADRNAAEFRRAFDFCGFAYDDFIRTTQERHTSRVEAYIRELLRRGDVYLGDYEGWWDESQEEYLTETVAHEHGYQSPVTGRPLVKRREKNYFFRLSAYQQRLSEHIAANPGFIRPEARRNEVLGRLREQLQDIPISRAVGSDAATQWGIRMPDDPGHRVYVWIDALFNYLTAIDTPERAPLWPAEVQMMAKDILWFHAVIWPCMLMALEKPLPGVIYAHAYWVREGRKMSKSLGNFVTIEVMEQYAARYSLDALRWYLFTQGPHGSTDADFGHGKFVEVYNADLANGLGNCASRVGNMIEKYFGGVIPCAAPLTPVHPDFDWPALCEGAGRGAQEAAQGCDVAGALQQGVDLIRKVDQFINVTAPFKLAKTIEADPAAKGTLAAILVQCAEAVRIASILMSPALITKAPALWRAWHCVPPEGTPLADLVRFGDGPASLRQGGVITKGEALFMRADPAEAPPA
ncbi:MAG: methionine--tRNA ligase [Phycisphaeraceae bacterium]|nr:methionine--tRNA ligase [Phycisphaeraceae bacterium]